ncbi:MAG: hypothetical protein ACI3W6_06335, partial [Clostridia bacterium]
QDTIRLLRECDAGIHMGISAIDEVLHDVSGDSLKRSLRESRSRHEHLQDEIDDLLAKYQDEGKDPSPLTQGMSWLKTNTKLAADPSDETVADLVSDGCHMGVKNLHRYLNQYKAADETSKDIAKRLISLEEELDKEVRAYL